MATQVREHTRTRAHVHTHARARTCTHTPHIYITGYRGGSSLALTTQLACWAPEVCYELGGEGRERERERERESAREREMVIKIERDKHHFLLSASTVNRGWACSNRLFSSSPPLCDSTHIELYLVR